MDEILKKKIEIINKILDIIPQLNLSLDTKEANKLLLPLLEEFHSVYCNNLEDCPVASQHLYKLTIIREASSTYGYSCPDTKTLEINITSLMRGIKPEMTGEEKHEQLVYNLVQMLTTVVHEHQHCLQDLLDSDEIPEEEKQKIQKLIPLAAEMPPPDDIRSSKAATRVLENERFINPGAKKFEKLSDEQIDGMAFLWYLDCKREVDARMVERKWLADFYDELFYLQRDNPSLIENVFRNDQTRESFFLLQKHTGNSLNALTKAEQLFEDSRDANMGYISFIMSPDLIIDNLVARAVRARYESYKITSMTPEFAENNPDELNLFLQRKKLYNQEVAQGLWVVCKKLDHIYKVSPKQLYWKLMQNGLTEVAEEFALLITIRKPEFLKNPDENQLDTDLEEGSKKKRKNKLFNTKTYFEILLTQDISLETLSFADQLSPEQISTLVSKFASDGKWAFVEELCSVASLKKGLNVANSQLKQPLVNALSSKLQNLLSLPIEKISFDQLDQMLNLMFSVGLSGGFQSIFATKNPPKEEQLKQIHSLFLQYHELAHLKASSIAGRVLSADEFRFGYASDRRPYLSSQEQRREQYKRTYGQIEYIRKMQDIKAFQKISELSGFEEDDFESY